MFQKFIVVTSHDAKGFGELVSGAIQQGWQLSGAVSIVSHNGLIYFAQGMVRMQSPMPMQRAGGSVAEEPYYEIISALLGGKVEGVCRDPNDHDGSPDDTFGLITQKQYDRFGDHSWETPKSKRRFRLVPQPKKLEEIK